MSKFVTGDYVVCVRKPENCDCDERLSEARLEIDTNTVLEVKGDDSTRYQLNNFVVMKSEHLDACFEKIAFDDSPVEIGNHVACIDNSLNRFWRNKMFKIADIVGDELKIEGRSNYIKIKHFKKTRVPALEQTLPPNNIPQNEKFKIGDEVIIAKTYNDRNHFFFGKNVLDYSGMRGRISFIRKDIKNNAGHITDQISLYEYIGYTAHPDELIKMSDILPEIGNTKMVGRFYAGQKVIQGNIDECFSGTNTSTILTIRGFENTNNQHTVILKDELNREFRITSDINRWGLLPAELILGKINLTNKVIELIKNKKFTIKSDWPQNPTINVNFFQYVGDEKEDDEGGFVHNGWLLTCDIDYIETEFDYFIYDERKNELMCIGSGVDVFTGTPISIKDKINERIEKGIFDLEKPNIDVNKSIALNYLFRHLNKLNIKNDAFNLLIKINDRNVREILNEILTRDNLEYSREAGYVMKTILSILNN